MLPMVIQTRARPSTTLRLLCAEAAKHGVSPEACLENTSVSAEMLTDTDASHSTEDEILAIENLMSLVPNNVGLGVAVGRATNVHAFGIWGFAILTSPTLRAAIETAIDYARLSFMIADMSLAVEGDEARLEFDLSDIPQMAQRFILERHLVTAVKFITDLLQQPEFDAFEARYKENAADYAQQLTGITSVPIKIAQPVNALAFPTAILDKPLPKSDAATLKFCLNQCKQLLEQQTGTLPHWSQQVRDTIVDNIGTDQQIEDVAAKLSLTERTLRRRLTDEGTSFRQLYSDARMAVAHELLASAGLNIETVSWRVGYAEPASFARAFAKKYGKTPGEVRKQTNAKS